MTVQTETCANCGDVIGALEDSYVWKEHAVCSACYERLSKQPSPPLEIPASEFADPLEPVAKKSTWSPMKAALVEKAYQERVAPRRNGWATAAVMGLVVFVAGMIAAYTLPQNLMVFGVMAMIAGGLLLWIVLAFLPYVIAQNRRHPNLSGVQMLTLLGLFIPVLWLVAIVWAIMASDPNS